MCRLLAYVAPAPRNASEVLGPEQLERFAKLAELHSHGWGAAWVERPGAPVGHHREIADLRAGGAFDVLTQEQPAVAMGRLAAEMLMEETSGDAEGHEHRQVVLQPELVVRGSSLTPR